MRLVASITLVVSLGVAVFAADRAKAEKALRSALATGDAAAIERACDELIEAGGKESLAPIVAELPRAQGDAYWQLAGAAAGFKDRAALDELGRFLLAHQTDALARDVLFSLQNNASPLATVPLAAVLEKGKYDLQLMAADQLAMVRAPEAVDALIAALERESGPKGDAELRARVEDALALLTGESLGDAANWRGWWKDHRDKPLAAPAKKDDEESSSGRTKARDREFLRTMEKAAPENVVVLASDEDYDHMGDVLEENKIPHVVVQRPQFDKDPAKVLKPCAALLVNCNDYHKVPLAPESLQKLKAWVENDGGHLYTEDWSLVDVSGALWPDKVGSGTGGEPRLLSELEVRVTPGRGSTSHPLLRGVWQRPGGAASPARRIEASWQVDDQSAAIEIRDPKSVVVLLEAAALKDPGAGNTAVAVTFRAGKGEPKKTATGRGTGEWASAPRGGRVLHTLSHWGKQKADKDGAALHNMLIDFLLEAAKRRGLSGGSK